MTAEPANVNHPPHPTYALTTAELSRYRSELEHAVQRLGTAPVVTELREKLDEVVQEQESRLTARTVRRGAVGL
jgi:hypothetical protein